MSKTYSYCYCLSFVSHQGDERAIEFVAMATRDDLNANAEFIRLADTFVEVPSGSNKVHVPFAVASSCFALLTLCLLSVNRTTMQMLISFAKSPRKKRSMPFGLDGVTPRKIQNFRRR